MNDTKKKYDYYFSTNSVLYIDASGTLKRKYCPFEVIAKVDIPPIYKGDIVWVEAVKITPDGMDVYIIKGRGYYVLHFKFID